MKFTKPAGATADLRELEFISALHQTGGKLRRNGSIRAIDISKFLMSRYGIRASEEEITETIAKGFGGGGVSEADGDTLDLTEVLAILLVPTLIKAEMSLHRDYLERKSITGNHLRQLSDHLSQDENKKLSMGDFFHDHNPSVKSSDNEIHILKAGPDEVWGAGKQDESRALRGETRWPDSDLIGFVLNMILKDVTGDEEPKPLTKELLKKIFLFYGEHDVAEDEDLLDEMMQVASHMKGFDEEEANVMLNQFTFAHCLTDDVRKYQVDSEEKLTTNYFDAFKTIHSTKESDDFFQRKLLRVAGTKCDEITRGLEDDTRPVELRPTFPSIDYCVDTFRSKTYVILLWVTYIFFYAAFIFGKSNDSLGNLNCTEKNIKGQGFGCVIAQGIVRWLILMATLVIIGSTFILFSSIGHSVNPSNPLLILVSMGVVGVFTILPVVRAFTVLEDPNGDGSVVSTDKSESESEVYLYNAIFSSGVILLLLGMQNLLHRVTPNQFLQKYKFLKQVLSSGTVRMEKNMKQAAAFKINRLVRNACAVHQAAEYEHGSSTGNESSYGRSLLAYSKTVDDTEEIGGFFWTWARLRDGKLFHEEGIWLNNRVLQGTLGQLFLCMWLFSLLFIGLSISDGLYSLFGLELSAKWRVRLPLALAFILAELNALSLATVYIPSSVRTILSYRNGAIKSLHDADFPKLRINIDDVSFIFGSMFWGCIVSSVMVFLFSFLILVVMCAEPFLDTLLSLTATIIGLLITIGMKTVFLIVARKLFHDGAFYRKNPAAMNLIIVVLESWNLGISTAYVLKRMVTLIVAAFFFVGRIDIPFLAEGADEVGPVPLDKFPFIFRKDLLSHEAHRHPYLERLGAIYMMKLRYGDKFGREAGTSWRLLFVFALMPWLRKYRIRVDENMSVAKFKFAKDGSIFKKFSESKSESPGRGFRPLANEPIETSPNKTMKMLEEENVSLKTEIKRLRDLEKEIEQLRSKLATKCV